MLGQEVGQSVKNSVLVRAYEDEPIVLTEVGREGDSVLVSGGAGSMIGFRGDRVYAYSPEIFHRLRDAFDRRNTKLLASIWREARRA